MGAQPGGEINGRSPPCRTRSGEPRYGVGPASDRVRLLSASISAISRSPSAGPAAESGADARPRRLDAPILLRKILDPYGPPRRSSRPSASRLTRRWNAASLGGPNGGPNSKSRPLARRATWYFRPVAGAARISRSRRASLAAPADWPISPLQRQCWPRSAPRYK